MPGPISVGELARRLDSVTRSIDDGFKDVRSQIGGLATAYVLKAVYDVELKQIRDDVDDVKNRQEWIIRLVGGAVILALLSLVVVGRKGF